MSVDSAFRPAQPIGDVRELERLFRGAEKPSAEHLLGLEHEKLLFVAADARAPHYDEAAGIAALYARLVSAGYEGVAEGGSERFVALRRGKATVSLEPGGQLEFSGSPLASARAAHRENLEHLAELRRAASEVGLIAVNLGYRPFGTPADVPFVPRARFAVMQSSLPRHGKHALAMMTMTASLQVSLDFSDEADCARKLGVLARLTPLLVALFANSPLAAGQPSGHLSYRTHVWSDVDPARCGYLQAMLNGELSYREYVEWALDAPVLFLRRGDDYVDPNLRFRELLARGWQGSPPTFADWENHVSTLFPEVRVKRVIEVRAADGASAELAAALAALLRGVVYDRAALDAAARLMPIRSLVDHAKLHADAGRLGLAARAADGTSLQVLARELVGIARTGLSRIDSGDVSLLDPLEEIAVSGEAPAVRVLEAFESGLEPRALLARFAA